jgi:hypothetical protein
LTLADLLGTRVPERAEKGAGCRTNRVVSRNTGCFYQPEIDNFYQGAVIRFEADHQVPGLNVAVNKVVLMGRSQSSRNLAGDFQRRFLRERAPRVDDLLQCLALNKLHGIKIAGTRRAKMKDRSDIFVSERRGSTGLPDKSLAN